MTILSYAGHAPSIDAGAWVAPDATVSGDVMIGAGSRISTKRSGRCKSRSIFPASSTSSTAIRPM